jgi:two-component system, response regulator
MFTPLAFSRPVLVVDDSPDDVFLIRRLFDKAGVAQPLMPFLDSAEALAYLRSIADSSPLPEQIPAALFLDIKMPRVHGFVLLKWIRRQESLDPMRVVMLSGSEDPGDRLRAAKLGADDYLVKYPEPSALVRALGLSAAVAA